MDTKQSTNEDIKQTTANNRNRHFRLRKTRRDRDRSEWHKMNRPSSPCRSNFRNHGRNKPGRIHNVTKAVECTHCNPKPTNRLIRHKLSQLEMENSLREWYYGE